MRWLAWTLGIAFSLLMFLSLLGILVGEADGVGFATQ
jgi:hypothetical protein